MKPQPSAPPSHHRGRPILAAGLTPAWQQILVFEEFHLGAVNRACDVHWCASGKVLNVGWALHHLGADARVLSPQGGPSGAALKQDCARRGLSVIFIDGSAPTRICTTVLDTRQGVTTELVENAPPATPGDLNAFQQAFARAATDAGIVVLSGSLPAGAPASFYRDLILGFPGPVLLDVRGEELLWALQAKPFLVKPNREELARTLGAGLRTEAELLGAMRELNRRGAQWVVITQGKDPVLVTHAARACRLRPPAVHRIVNPIGCGDCLAAGIAWSLQQDQDVLTAVRWGMAAAADNLGQLLPAQVSRERMGKLFSDAVVEDVP